MTFAQLRALICVLDSGGFTRAATRTGTSQSAVSHAIAALESELGATLIARDHGRVRPTELGLRVAELARRILSGADEIKQHATHATSSIVASVQIAATRSAAACLLPAALGLLAEREPGIDVTVLEGGSDEIPHWLDEQLVDVAFLCAAPGFDGFEAERLFEDEHVAVVPAASGLADGSAIAPRQLAGEHFVMPVGGCEACVAELFAAAGESLRPAYFMRHPQAIVTLVAQGLGVSVLSGLAARDIPEGVVVTALDPPVRRAFTAYWPRRRETRAARAVVDLVRDVAGASRPEATTLW